jgi:hypothetical protein
MRARATRLPGLLAAIAAVSLSVVAPLRAEEPKDKYGKLHVGPLYLTPRLTVTAGVDNNVYNTPVGVQDRAVAVTPGLDAVVPVTRHARLRGSGGVAPHYFDQEESQRFTDVFGTAGAEVEVGPVTVRGGIGGGRFRQRFSLEIDERLLRHESSHYYGATLRLGRRISVDAGQTDLTSTFDEAATLDGQSVSGSLDRKTVTRTATVNVPLTRKTTILPFADFVEDRFLVPQPGLPGAVTSQRYGLAFQFSPLAFLDGRVAGGVRHFGAGQGVAPYTGPFVQANVSMPFIIGTRLALSALRDVSYMVTPVAADAPARNSATTGNYRAEWQFELPWHLQGRIFGGYSEAHYLLPVLVDGRAQERTDHSWIEGGALLRRFGSHVSVGGIVQTGTRVSPVDGHSYDGALYGLTGEVHF